MKIGIIDADLLDGGTTVPNLVCMKLSGYYKEYGHDVELLTDYNSLDFDKIFIAKVFSKTKVPDGVIDLPHVAYGGTGFFYDKAPNLPDYIEHHHPDYSLYDDYIKGQIASGVKPTKFKNYTEFSIGYTTRGCFRKCDFCVNRKYDRVYRHSPVSEFLDESRKYIMLLDDNVLAFPHWRDVFEELQSTGKRFQFKQGMDIRLMTEEKCKMLFSAKYYGNFIFAFDNIEDYPLIEKKLQLIRRYTSSEKVKFYVLCGFDRNGKYDSEFFLEDIKGVYTRIKLLAKYNAVPYLMRFNRHKEFDVAGVYTIMANWINWVPFFKKKSLLEVALQYKSYMQYLSDFKSKYPDFDFRLFFWKIEGE